MQKNKFDDFTTQIQSDEIASLRGGKPGSDWINDFDDMDDDDEFIDD